MNLAQVWQSHVEKWRDCRGCPLCDTRTSVVLARGDVPSDAVLVGEAPGRSEDVSALPFVGPAGKLLDDIVREARRGMEHLRLSFTNIIACIPLDGEEGDRLTKPQPEDVRACRPRLEEFLIIAAPRLIVAVGSVAEQNLRGLIGSRKTIHIDHPSRILQSVIAMRGTMTTRAVVTLRKALSEL